MKSLKTSHVFFLVLSILSGLAACSDAPERVQPAEESQMQQAYAAKDGVITAKNALNDLYRQELSRRKLAPDSKPFISDTVYDIAWKTAQDATVAVDNLIKEARGPAGTGEFGYLNKSLLADVKKKTEEVNAARGTEPEK